MVALARLTLKKPKVVLLDEPTSNLDQLSEIRVLNALSHWTKDKTLLLVTHRMQALRLVNRVVVVDNGKVVMDGPRDAVLEKLQQQGKTVNQSPVKNQTQAAQIPPKSATAATATVTVNKTVNRPVPPPQAKVVTMTKPTNNTTH